MMTGRQDETNLPQDLDCVMTRLAACEQVEGVLAVGSLANHTLTPTSDYDLVIVLCGVEWTWYVGVTEVGGRFTDLLFVSTDALRQIQEQVSPFPDVCELAAVIRWFECGKILFDRNGRLAGTQQHVGHHNLVPPISDEAVYGAWFATNYNLAVASRLCLSPDPHIQAVADIRMAVYGHSDLWFNYFTIRRISWSGDKAAVQYLSENDPGYLELYQSLVKTADRVAKLECYRRAAAHVAAPLGGLWVFPLDVINIQSPPWTWAELMSG